MTSFSLPIQVVETLDYFDDADRGQVYSAIFAYVITGKEPGDELSGAARGAFGFARLIIDPIIKRRNRAKERRKAKKAQEKIHEASKASGTTQITDISDTDESFKQIKMTVSSGKMEISEKSESVDSCVFSDKSNASHNFGISEVFDDSGNSEPSHIEIMQKIIDRTFKLDMSGRRRYEKIRYELMRRFPGIYSDIIYDRHGKIKELVPFDFLKCNRRNSKIMNGMFITT